MRSKYLEAGVDVKKKGIEIFRETVTNVYPNAFCVVTKDPYLKKYGLVTHADSAGSKPVQSYLNWKETGDVGWFKSLAQDVLAMNLNDITCVAAKPMNFVDYIALNPLNTPKIELLSVLNTGFKECLRLLENYGLKIEFSGGETADLPDQMRTLDISGVINGRVELSEAITGGNISPSDIIIGLRSGGKTKLEEKENSGIMCNGLTLARICLLSKDYQHKYPEIADPGGRGYYGKFRFDHYMDELNMTIGEALLSPMRFYAPIVNRILEEHGNEVTGLVHNMGGGLTKCLRIGKRTNFIKDNLFNPDPIFALIQKESGENWRNMFENFNMGVGFEIITKREAVDSIISISEKFQLEARVIGRCEASTENNVTIKSRWGSFCYS